MKKIIIPIIAFVATLVSCQKDMNVLRLEMEHFNSNGEKLHLNEDNYACWDNNDKVAVNGDSYSISVGADKNTATIDVGETEGPYYAFAPASMKTAYNNGIYQFTYPAEISRVKKTSANETFGAPMYATSAEDNTLVFRNQGAVLKIAAHAASDPVYTGKIISIKVTVDGGILSGTFSASAEGATYVSNGTNSVQITYASGGGKGTPIPINGTSYDFLIPIPVTTGTGLRVEIATTDGLYYFEKNASVNFERSKIYTIPFDLRAATFIEPIHYTSAETSGNHCEFDNIGWSADYQWYMYNKPNWVLIFNNVITEIPQNAFYNDTKAKSIIIPGTITSIGTNAFNGCTKLASITLYSSTVPTLGDDVFSNIGTDLTSGSTKLYVPAASVDAYKAAWGDAGFGYFSDANIIAL